MNVTINLMELDDVRSLRRNPALAKGVPVVDGALPPDFLVSAALEALERGDDPLWSSFFVFLDEDLGQIVGSGGFKSAPQEGTVEIGYGVAEERRSRGVATAAVFGLVALAFEFPEVDGVCAETAVVNAASRRVVEKVGFRWLASRDSDEDGPVDSWRLQRPHLQRLPS